MAINSIRLLAGHIPQALRDVQALRSCGHDAAREAAAVALEKAIAAHQLRSVRTIQSDHLSPRAHR